MPNMQNVMLYFDVIQKSIMAIEPSYQYGTASVGTSPNNFTIGTGQEFALTGTVGTYSDQYYVQLHTQQLSYIQTIDGNELKGLEPCIYLIQKLHNKVSNMVSNYANDGFGKTLALNDYLDVTNSASFYLESDKNIWLNSNLNLTQGNSASAFLTAQGESDTLSFFAGSLCFVKAFESVPYLFNITFQPVLLVTNTKGSAPSNLCRARLYLKYRSEYHVVGGV